MSTNGIDNPVLPRLNKRFVGRAAASGLGGGAALAGVMMVSGSTHGMGATSIFSQCFASFIWPMSTMADSTMPVTKSGSTPTTTMASGSMPTTTMASGSMPTTTTARGSMPTHHVGGAVGAAHGTTADVHALVGGLIHFALSAALGVVILSAIVLAGSAGLRFLTKPAGIITASIVSAVAIYFIVARGIAPAIDPAFGSGLSQGAFFLAHLFFGATVGILGAFWLPRTHHSSL